MNLTQPITLSDLGLMRVATAVPAVSPGDVDYNIRSISEAMTHAASEGASLLVLPELCITGYTCADLFAQRLLLDAARQALMGLAVQSAYTAPGLIAAVGLPLERDGVLYNCAALIGEGRVWGIVPKSFLPDYGEFYEKRWFASGAGTFGSIELGGVQVPFGTDLLFCVEGTTVGIEICEDLWAPLPPSTRLAIAGAEVILNLSASNEVIGKHDYLLSLVKQQSARLHVAYCYASSGFGESSTDVVFAGNGLIAESGILLAGTERFEREARMAVADVDIQALRHDRRFNSSWRDSLGLAAACRSVQVSAPRPRVVESICRNVNKAPFVPADDSQRAERCREILSIQSAGLERRLSATGCRTLVVGVSGGLDSTLALLVAARAFAGMGLPASGIIGVTMPGFGTTGRTYDNATALVHALGATLREVNIAPAVRQHFTDIGHDESIHDVTYENSQARERTQILMDIANATAGMVLGTGDLSELALGWCTYNGDHMSMYAVNTSVPKTLVRHLVQYIADTTADTYLHDTLVDIIDTPISPELLPATAGGDIAQLTEDLVGPYALHDFVLYQLLRYGHTPLKIYHLACAAFADEFSPEVIKHWLKVFYRRFFNQQFKRSCMPDGPKVGSVCLSPRGDWRMPSDASAAIWLRQCDTL